MEVATNLVLGFKLLVRLVIAVIRAEEFFRTPLTIVSLGSSEFPKFLKITANPTVSLGDWFVYYVITRL